MTCFIRAACLEGYEEIVRSYGENPTLLLKKAGVIQSQLRDPDTFIYYEHFLQALELAKIECNNDVFGLELGLKQSVHNLGMMKNYMYRQGSILQALGSLNKYIHLYAEGFSLTITPTGNHYKVEFNHLHQEYFTAQKAQFTLAACFNIFTELLGYQTAVHKMSFKQPIPHQDTRYFEERFGCSMMFNAEQDAIYLPKTLVMQKPAVPNDEKNLTFSNEKLSQSKPSVNATEFIYQTIKSLLATGECNKNNIALCMGIHPKKLQRLLTEKNTSYREIIEQVRQEEAIKLLQQPQLSLTMIALKLGYSELAVFSRNFKAWFQQTPSQWRDKNVMAVA
ncbi:AraC family transcriptional regulator [Vibrio rumoiensis]|uniref:AraC family transcriptional regulator n=1 Tax=Vibrio rumoiensis TaxID=76258 RepID=UPI000B5C3AA2|nr:AraC family transcriptional regulator [Vibrio rumoiensis]